jgi:phosphatidylglycerophosphate synthase
VRGSRVGGPRVEPRRRAARRGGGERLSAPAPLSPAAALLVVLGRVGDGLGRLSLAGLSVERRIVLAAERAGFDGIASPASGPLTPSADCPLASAGAPRRIVAMAGHVVPQTAWLRALRAMPLERETLYVDGAAVAVIETDHPARVLDAAARCGAADDLPGALDGAVTVVRRPLEPSGRFPLAGPADVAAAEAWLLRSLIKPSEGFMSRHLERRLSLAVTRRLAGTRVTPNAMTLVSVAIGLMSAPFFVSSTPTLQVIGALLFLAHSILDGCDGELARLKFLESRGGAILDFWGDNLVHVCVWGGLAVGWALDAGGVWPLALGAVAIASTIASAQASAGRFIGGAAFLTESPAGRLAEALSHRDFIYLILILSVFGKARWFLVLTAAGTPLFLGLLLVLGGRRRGARQP